MLASLFITGAHGYIGRHLLRRLNPERFAAIYRLVHRHSSQDAPGEPVPGDLAQPSTYRKALAGCDTVIHLAALTGKHKRDDYFRVNAAGTAGLVAACEANRVRRFLHLSTIAVNYPDVDGYYYAQSKQDAEDAVRTSGLRWAIIRPTMIFGPNAPVLKNLEKLALGRVAPVVGDGRALVQPIHIDDLVTLILSIVENDDFGNQIIEAGGPETLPIEELLGRIRKAHGLAAGRVVHIPLGLARPAVAAFAGLLPITAGQLMALATDGTAEGRPAGTIGVDDAVRLSLEGEEGERLREECRVYSRYLIGSLPGDYVEGKYLEFHRLHPEAVACAGFDRLLMRASGRRPGWTRLADTYASRFAKTSALRRKLTLVLALLESTEPSASQLDAPAARSRAGAWAGAAFAALRYTAALAASCVLFAPLHAALGRRRTE